MVGAVVVVVTSVVGAVVVVGGARCEKEKERGKKIKDCTSQVAKRGGQRGSRARRGRGAEGGCAPTRRGPIGVVVGVTYFPIPAGGGITPISVPTLSIVAPAVVGIAARRTFDSHSKCRAQEQNLLQHL